MLTARKWLIETWPKSSGLLSDDSLDQVRNRSGVVLRTRPRHVAVVRLSHEGTGSELEPQPLAGQVPAAAQQSNGSSRDISRERHQKLE